MRRSARPRGIATVALALLAIALAGILFTRTTAQAVACVSQKGEVVLAQNGACGAGYVRASLPMSVKGPPGPAGPRGATGDAGRQGPQGPAGLAGITTYAKSLALPGVSSSRPNETVLTTIGPFTLTGVCFVLSGSVVAAETFLSTGKDHASYAVVGYPGVGDFDAAAGLQQIGVAAEGSPGHPAVVSHEPMFLDSTGDVDVNVFDNVGVYLGSGGGSNAPACSWSGYYFAS